MLLLRGYIWNRSVENTSLVSILRFAAENVTSEVVRAPELALSVEFVLQQLLKITRMFDSSDEVGK